MLVAAKWREFSCMNPNNEEQETEDTVESDYIPKSKRSRSSALKVREFQQQLLIYNFKLHIVFCVLQSDNVEEDEEEEEKGRKKRGRSKKGTKKNSKVPTLKIKLGKRKRGSSVSIYLGILSFRCILNFYSVFELLKFFFVTQDEEENETDKKSEGSDRDSDAEFEQMLQEAEEASPENSKEKDDVESTDAPAVPRKAKTKFGMKNKRKPKRKMNDSKNGEVSSVNVNSTF